MLTPDSILKMPTFEQRGRAIAQALDTIKSNPNYKSAAPEKQAAIRANLYRRVVQGSYIGFGLDAPDERTWVEASGRDTTAYNHSVGSHNVSFMDSFKQSDKDAKATDFEQGLKSGLSSIGMFGIEVSNKFVNKAYGLAEHLTQSNKPLNIQIKEDHKAQERFVQNKIDQLKNNIQSADFWHETHSRNTFLGSIAFGTGDFTATLPLYEALGTEKAIMEAGKAIPITARLLKSPVGKFVANRIINASDGYLATLATSGGDTEQAKQGAEAFAAFGGAVEGAGAGATKALIKVASSPLTKKWTANVIAMGGKQFANSIAESAYAENQTLDWWIKNGSKEGITEYKNAIQLGPDFHLYPSSEEAGKFVKDGKVFEYKNKVERQNIFDELHKEWITTRDANDPVMAKLHEAEKASQQSIAIIRYKKLLRDLTPEEHESVLAERSLQIDQAAQELPAHVPDLVKAETSSSIEEDMKLAQTHPDPEVRALLTQFDKSLGLAKINPVDVTTENIVNNNAEATGIKNSKAASKKLRKSTKEVEKSAYLSPSDFLKGIQSTKAYLRAPRNRVALHDAVGALAQGNWDTFYETLKKSDRSGFKFEDPTHRMLYMLNHKADMPKSMYEAIVRRLQQTEKYKGVPLSKLQEYGKNILNQMHDVVKGKSPHGNRIFNSTKVDIASSTGTKWDRQLTKETIAETIKANRKALKNHPQALNTFDVAVRKFQTRIFKSQTPEEYRAYMDTLKGSVKTNTKNAKAGNPFQF